MYISTSQFIDKIGETEIKRALRLREADNIPQASIAAAIEYSCGVIDNYVAMRRDVPISNPPMMIQKLAIDIARYEIMDDRATEEVQRRYKDAIALLKDYAAGKGTLGFPSDVTGGGTGNNGGNDSAEITSQTRQNTRPILGKLT